MIGSQSGKQASGTFPYSLWKIMTNCTLIAFGPPLETFENHRLTGAFGRTETGAFGIHWI